MGWLTCKSNICYHIFSCLAIVVFRRRVVEAMYIYCTSYRNRWGKLMVAADYGYTAWRFWVPAGRRKA